VINQEIVNLTVKNIKFVRCEELDENLQKSADICDSIVKYYKKNDKVSDKQLVVLEKFNDNIQNYEFNYKIKIGYYEYLKELECDLETAYF